jgi:L-threonylcarbamoyladenylate synthase
MLSVPNNFGKLGSGPLSFKLRQAARIIRAGGVVAYPTEGVFGLGCDPDCFEAVQHILDLKRRSESAGLILIADRRARLEDWIDPTRAEQRRLASDKTHDRRDPVTWIVTASARTPTWITGGRPTVAVRVTHHPIAAALCRYTEKPLVSTSANRSGHLPSRSALSVRCRFGRDIDYIVGGAVGTRLTPTEIRDAGTGNVLRPG